MTTVETTETAATFQTEYFTIDGAQLARRIIGPHAGTIWRYQDDRGVAHIGHVQAISDFGGTDIRYTFRDCSSGALNVVSGQRLKGAGPVDHSCPIRDRIISELLAGVSK